MMTDPEWCRENPQRAAEEIERMQDALRKITHWGDAYPEDIFIPPTTGQCKQAHEALAAIGLSLDKFSAHAMRHVIRGVANIAADALGD